MKSFESLRLRAEAIVANEPIWEKAFPPRPWGYTELQEIADIVEFSLLNDVINDDPWIDWLDRWKFNESAK